MPRAGPGRSLSEFMRTLDIYSNSGRVHTRLRNQMKRLFGCTVTMIYEEPGGFARVSSFVADKHEFWWNERKPNVPSLWRCCMIQLRREWGRFSNFSFRTPQRRISSYPARPSG